MYLSIKFRACISFIYFGCVCLRSRRLFLNVFFVCSLFGRKACGGSGIDRFTVTQQKNKLETAQWKKPGKRNVIKDWYINNLSNSPVFVSHGFWVICRSVSRTFVELCMETPYWVCRYGAPIWHPKSTKTSGVHFFYKSSFFSLEN